MITLACLAICLFVLVACWDAIVAIFLTCVAIGFTLFIAGAALVGFLMLVCHH